MLVLVVENISNFFEAVDPASRSARIGKLLNFVAKKDTQHRRNIIKGDSIVKGSKYRKTMSPAAAGRYDLAAMAGMKANRAEWLAKKFSGKHISPLSVISNNDRHRTIKSTFSRVAASLAAKRKASPWQ